MHCFERPSLFGPVMYMAKLNGLAILVTAALTELVVYQATARPVLTSINVTSSN